MKLLHIDNLKRGMVVGRNLPRGEGGEIPWLREGVPLTDELIATMRRHGIDHIFIDDVTTRIRGRLLGPSVNRPMPAVIKPPPLIAPAVRESAVAGIRGMFQNVAIGAEDLHASSLIVRQLDRAVSELVEVFMLDRRAVVNIHDLKSYDEYTYHHSLSVAVLSIAIGQYLNIDRKRLVGLGLSAIMHDIGKTSVPVGILNKAGRLTDEEFSLVKTHSPAGYEYLLRTAIGDDDIRQGVLYHHERVDGAGYPYGVREAEIPLWSRIIAVADVFDALTSNRPYREPMPPAEALEYIMGGIGSSFDYDVVSAFTKKVELYPVGSFVELSNGKHAVVLAAASPMRPVVRLLDSGGVVDLSGEREYLNVVISALLPDALAVL